MTIVPRFVLIVMFRVPARGSPLAGGVPTSLRSVFGAADALGSGLGFHLQAAGAAAAVALGGGQGVVAGEPGGAGGGDAAADPLGWGWLPMVSVWRVMSFFGWPPPPSRLAKALSAPAAATCCTTSRPAVTCPKRVKLGGSTPSL